MSNKAIALTVLLWLGCSADPMPLPPSEMDTQDVAIPPSTNQDTELDTVGSDSPESTGYSTTTWTDDTGSSETQDSLDPGDCPWECLALTGPNACASAEKDGSFHNPNYDCGNEGYVCCQPPNAKGGIKKPCNDQPAMSCAASCAQGLVQNNEFYCNNAKLVCCEDPNGPAPTCAELGGTCIPPFFYECDKDETEVDLGCDGFGESCCLPPACPWGCVTYKDSATCSQGKNPPVAVRNYDYSCEEKGQVCCQPYEIADTDTSGPSIENCNQQGALFSCEASCGDRERQRVDFYCPNAAAKCCEDIRKDCESGLGGTCDNDWLGNCATNFEPNPDGRCPAGLLSTPTCCTKIASNNTCAKEGGVCVEITGIEDPTDILTACPFGYTPDIQTLCGDLRLCCKSLFGG